MQAKERVRKSGASGTKAGGGDDGTTSKLQQKQAQIQQGKIEDIQPQQQQISTADYFSYDKEMSLTERRLLFKICQSKQQENFITAEKVGLKNEISIQKLYNELKRVR